MDSNTDLAVRLMLDFAERTGLDSNRPNQRYLWTDAFAVANFLALERRTADPKYFSLALRLVERVHHTLGKHRPDDQLTGWLSGLGARDGESHPTCAGLRIGKRLPERAAGEAFDEQLEWQRDGQYFHYLTKWMFALDQVADRTQEPRFNLWARELADTAHRAFVYGPGSEGARRMYWKMSIDLSRPLVLSMGQHDPLDGLVTYTGLQLTASRLPNSVSEPSLARAVTDFSEMIAGRALATADPLGLGGILLDIHRLDQLARRGAPPRRELRNQLLDAALLGITYYSRQNELFEPASRRLAFRELGLALGLLAVELLLREARSEAYDGANGSQSRLAALAPYLALGSCVTSFWLHPEHRGSPLWAEHRNINEVMLATCLVPEGCLVA